MLVRQLTQFVTIRQFPPADRSLPPLSKSKWWIPAAARVLALLSTHTNYYTNNNLTQIQVEEFNVFLIF